VVPLLCYIYKEFTIQKVLSMQNLLAIIPIFWSITFVTVELYRIFYT